MIETPVCKSCGGVNGLHWTGCHARTRDNKGNLKETATMMTTDQYAKDAERTEAMDFEALKARLADKQLIRLLHGAIGIATEAGELLDQLKKHIYYGKPLDMVNVLEEHGDILWYLAAVANGAGFTFEASMIRNIAKLKARYPEQFSEEKAVTRDLDTERKILEG